jgi:3-hydroxyacyl-[acyl-carrier-protein] dehydratase
MYFSLVDRVIERSPTRIVTLKQVSLAEEYLQDHFPTFPVLPGVMMLECMVQASRDLLVSAKGPDKSRHVLGRVRALKYGRFVKPGATLRIEMELAKDLENDSFDLKGQVLLIEPGHPSGEELPVAASGRLTMRPVRLPL